MMSWPGLVRMQMSVKLGLHYRSLSGGLQRMRGRLAWSQTQKGSLF